MGVFGNLQKKFNMRGVRVELLVDTDIPKTNEFIEGVFVLTTKVEKTVKLVEIELVDEFSSGRKDSKESKTFQLGKVILEKPIQMPLKGRKEINFQLPFKLHQTEADNMQDQGGVVGAFGKIESHLKSEEHKYTVWIHVHVEDSWIEANDYKEVFIS